MLTHLSWYRLCFLCGKSTKGSLQAPIRSIWMDTHGPYSHCCSKPFYCKQHPRGVDLVSSDAYTFGSKRDCR